jgi:hypothetical protein
MKTLNLLIAAFFAITFTSTLSAQSFTFQPGEVVTEYVELESYKNIQVDIVHPDLNDVTFGWVTVENNILDKWEYTSCDNGGCYALLPDSALVGPLADTVPGYIRLTVNPRDQAGTSTAIIYVYNVKYPDDGQLVTLEVIASGYTAIGEIENEAIRVFPNPVSEYITLDNTSLFGSDFELVDLTGKAVVKDFIGASQSKTYNLSSYARGVYFIRFQNDAELKSKKIILQ